VAPASGRPGRAAHARIWLRATAFILPLDPRLGSSCGRGAARSKGAPPCGLSPRPSPLSGTATAVPGLEPACKLPSTRRAAGSAVAAYLLIYLRLGPVAPGPRHACRRCADPGDEGLRLLRFLMLSLVLCIGPAGAAVRRPLPPAALQSSAFSACAHCHGPLGRPTVAGGWFGWYFAYSANPRSLAGLSGADTSVTAQLHGFRYPVGHRPASFIPAGGLGL